MKRALVSLVGLIILATNAFADGPPRIESLWYNAAHFVYDPQVVKIIQELSAKHPTLTPTLGKIVNSPEVKEPRSRSAEICIEFILDGGDWGKPMGTIRGRVMKEYPYDRPYKVLDVTYSEDPWCVVP